MESVYVIRVSILVVVAYLLGSVPFGLILTRLRPAADLRHAGSGNIGATNVLRTAGKLLGGLTLAGDLLKGAAAVWLAAAIIGPAGSGRDVGLALVILAAFGGHLYPVFAGFRGGKGVATAAGCFLAISPPVLGVPLAVFLLVVVCCRRVSPGSLAAAVVLPISVRLLSVSNVLAGCALVITIWIFWRHRDNIKRLVSGREPALWPRNR